MKSQIAIKVLNIDEGDQTIHYQLFLSNGKCSSTIDFYGYPDEFKEFATELSGFPQSINHIVNYELGERDSNWAYYIQLQAKCVEVNGQSIIKIDTLNYGNEGDFNHSIFAIAIEPASINQIGRNLSSWNPLESTEFAWTAD